MTPLADALRRLALHQDIPECAAAADEIDRLEAERAALCEALQSADGARREIERLRGLVEKAHRFDLFRTNVGWLDDVPLILVYCTACPGRVGETACKDPNGSPRTDEAKAIHAAHVRQILDGGAR